MKKVSSLVVALVGAIVAAAAFLLRGTTLAANPIGELLLGIGPNFAAVLLGVGLVAFVYALIFQKSFGFKATLILSVLLVAGLAAYEYVGYQFFGSVFDIWDIVASGVAAVLVCIIAALGSRKTS